MSARVRSPLLVPRPLRPSPRAGWLYYESYSSDRCRGVVEEVEGYPVGVCLQQHFRDGPRQPHNAGAAGVSVGLRAAPRVAADAGDDEAASADEWRRTGSLLPLAVAHARGGPAFSSFQDPAFDNAGEYGGVGFYYAPSGTNATAAPARRPFANYSAAYGDDDGSGGGAGGPASGLRQPLFVRYACVGGAAWVGYYADPSCSSLNYTRVLAASTDGCVSERGDVRTTSVRVRCAALAPPAPPSPTDGLGLPLSPLAAAGAPGFAVHREYDRPSCRGDARVSFVSLVRNRYCHPYGGNGSAVRSVRLDFPALTTYADGNCTAAHVVQTTRISTQCEADAAASGAGSGSGSGSGSGPAGGNYYYADGPGVNTLAYRWSLVTPGPAPSPSPAAPPSPARPRRPGGPSHRPTSAPSPSPRRNVTVRVTQTLGRINVSVATHATFVHVFQSAVAAVLAVPWQVRPRPAPD